MGNILKERSTLLIGGLYFIVSIINFRGIIFSLEPIGLLHDWGFPLYPEQAPQYLSSVLNAWNPEALGSYSYTSDALFRLILGLFAVPSIGFWIKISLIFIQFLAGFSMYWLLKKNCDSSEMAASCAGLFYMLTPVFFTRVIVGYYYYLIGYALLPIIVLTFFWGIKNKSTPYILLCGVLYGLASMQIQFVVIVPFLLLFFILFHRTNQFRSILALCQVIGVFILIQFPLIIYFLSSVFTSDTSFNQLTSSAQYFWIYFFPPQVSDAIMLFGKDYEFLFLEYFQNKILFIPFLISALLLPTIAYSIFRKRKSLPFIFLGILTIFLMLGTNPPFGILYQWIYERIPLAGLFRTSYHWAVLLAFSYAILLGLAYDEILRIIPDKTNFTQWIRDALIVAGCVFFIYLGYIFSHFSTLIESFHKRGIPPYFIDIGILICIVILCIFYCKSEIVVTSLNGSSLWLKNYQSIISILFIGMILIYAWPFFTGNFLGRLQVYSYDQEYHALFTNLQQEHGDFRVLWLPMISPIQYGGYQYPGHDQLIGYSPKPSFPQLIAMFNPESKYTAFLANLQYTQETEFFGDILNDFSSKYVIYRDDFKPVLPDYLPFGSVSGFEWNNTLPYTFLENQKDLRNTESGTNYSIWETKITPRISVQVPIAVAGDLSTKIGFSYAKTILGYDQNPAFLFLEDTNKANYQDLANTILFDGARTDDLLFSYINSSYLFDAGWYTQEVDARKGWTTTFNWWWYNTTMSAQPEYGAFTLSPNSTLNVNPNLASGNYSVYFKARSGSNSSNLTYALNSISGKIAIPNDTDAYIWYSLGHYNLTTTNLTIVNDGQSEIERIAFVPDSELCNAKNKVTHYLLNRSVLIIYEPENFNTTYTRHTFGSSRGYIELPANTNFTFNITIPKETEYSEYIRIRTHNQSSTILKIDDAQLFVPFSSPDEFTMIPVVNTTLSRGVHMISLQSTDILDFDMFFLKSTDYQYQQPNVILTYEQKSFGNWADPTHFSIKGNSKEPYFLTFNENYNPAWELINSSGHTFNHYIVNYYANGYYVNNSENETLDLKFVKQNVYFNTIIISLGSLIIIIILIIIGIHYQKRIK